MNRSRVFLALLSVLVALILQTTILAPGRIQPLGVAPALVTLVLIAVAKQVEAEYLILIGFTAGILMDLMGGSTLGLWAMVLTTVAYGAARSTGRLAEGPGYVVGIVFGLTVFGQMLFVLLATLFGQGIIGQPGVLGKIVLPGLWNLLLALPVFWLVASVFGSRKSRWSR